MKQGIEAVKETKEFVDKANKCSECGRKYNDFAFGRVSSETKEYFCKLAKKEFCDDWGMTLKWLCDFHEGLLPTGNERVELAEAKAEEALAQIAELRQMVGKPTEEKKTVRMCDGKEKVLK